MKRLGVIGTMVWDTIHGRRGTLAPVDEWGGIAYALSALEASLDAEWELVPLIKVGRDLAPHANDFLHSLTRRTASSRFIEVPNPNNRVTLQYESSSRRCEHLTGGVPSWTWTELGPLVADLDAVYVNFISGNEMSLETCQFFRHAFPGPIYADLHSLFLGTAPDGRRIPTPLYHFADWFNCFDVIQTNEDELGLLGDDPMAIAAIALAAGVRLFIVTLGDRGAVYFHTEPFALEAPAPAGGPIRTARVPATFVDHDGDPTGCGDVFGATLFAELLKSTNVEAAIIRSNELAARNLGHRGATHLHYHLRGEIAPR